MNLDQLFKAAKAYEAYNASKTTSSTQSTSTSSNKVFLQSGTKQANKDEQISDIISHNIWIIRKANEVKKLRIYINGNLSTIGVYSKK